jgi:tryptophan synthase alpha chain
MRGIYIVGNYPDRESFLKCFDSIIEAGYEFVEVGVPFSEPVADGPVIASAVQETLTSGSRAEDVLQELKSLNKGTAKLYIMTYANIIYSRGIKQFSDEYKDVLAGVIVPDVPNKLHGYFYDKGFEIPLIPFVTPESREEDIKQVAELKGDFIYFIGIRGITGGSADLGSSEIAERVAQIKAVTDKKIVMGFGIKDKAGADQALDVTGGFVVGTAAVQLQKTPDKYAEFVQSLI